MGERGVCACAHFPTRAQRPLGPAPHWAHASATLAHDGAGPGWRWARMGTWAHAQTPRSPTGLLDGVRHAKASREQLQSYRTGVRATAGGPARARHHAPGSQTADEAQQP